MTAHNLRGPVARIIGLTRLYEMVKNKAEEDDIRGKIVKSILDLDRVITDMNTILEIKKKSAMLNEVVLADTIQSVSSSVKDELEELKGDIQLRMPEVPPLKAVSNYIYSIFLNLITNAIKYRHPERPPKIVITGFRTQNTTVVEVTDNGLGMDLSMINTKLFNLYQRFHHHVDGRGMGLFLVNTQMKLMGGKIEVRSQLMEGTTFTLYFPDFRGTSPHGVHLEAS
jgi:signal transduction histidine kinase